MFRAVSCCRRTGFRDSMLRAVGLTIADRLRPDFPDQYREPGVVLLTPVVPPMARKLGEEKKPKRPEELALRGDVQRSHELLADVVAGDKRDEGHHVHDEGGFQIIPLPMTRPPCRLSSTLDRVASTSISFCESRSLRRCRSGAGLLRAELHSAVLPCIPRLPVILGTGSFLMIVILLW